MNYLSIIICFFLILSDYLYSFQIKNINIYSRIIIIILILLLFFIKEKKKELYIKILSLLILSLFYLLTGLKSLIYIYIYIKLLKKISSKKILKIYLVLSLIFFFSVICFWYINIDKSLIIKSKLFDGKIYNRGNLGFQTPNTWGIYWFSIIVISSLIINKNKSILFLLGSILTYFFYIKTYSRTSLLIISFYLFLLAMLTIMKKKFIKNRKYVIFVPVILTLLSIYLALNYNYNYNELNKLLSGRIMLANLAIKKYGISIISNKDIMFPLDNTYIYILVSKGVGSLIIILLIYSFSLYKLMKNSKNYKYIPYIICILLYGLSENNIGGGFQGSNFLNILLAMGLCQNNKINRRKNVYLYKENI